MNFKYNIMKNHFLSVLALLSLILFTVSSCDTNDNNDPNVPCRAMFYQLVGESDGLPNAEFNIFSYQKSTSFNFNDTIQELPSNAVYAQQLVGQRHVRSSIDDYNARIVYKMADMLISYQNGAVTQTVFPNGDTRNQPEFLAGNLYFLKPNSVLVNSPPVVSNFEITDESGSTISSTFPVNLSNAGVFNTFEISSTSDKTDNIFYLANTYLYKYNLSSDTLTTMQIDTFNSNNVFYSGIEYVDANTLYAFKGETANQSVKLVKIDISNTSNPVVSTLMDLTNSSALSFNPYSMVNFDYAYTQTDYDKCDNSFYFSFTDAGSIDSYLVEIKLNSNTITEYYDPNLTDQFFFGLDHLR